MAAEDRHERRPLWVRLVIREGMKRSAALALVGIFGLLAGIGLLVAAIASGSNSILGALALPLALAGACLCATGAPWSWLAVSRVDGNGKWP
jgi:hypothetical protein